jgi:plastocyanin
MRPVTTTLSAVALLAAAGPASAQAPAGHAHADAGPEISVGFSTFGPADVDVLTGDTVTWRVDGLRVHTVTAEDGSWSSSRIALGDAYMRRFDVAGSFPYSCVLHPGMRGQVDARTILLDPPAAPAAPGRAYPLSGRAALPQGTEIAIEGDSGSGFAPVATASVDDDGAFSAELVPRSSATYRAVAAGASSDPVQLLVLDRKVQASASRRGRRVTIRATATPASPGVTAVLQLRLRERFGWWPVRRARLDAASGARFRLKLGRGVPARVVLTLPDGATVLAESPPILGRAPKPEKDPHHHPRSP